jgi:hypothetical protein
MTALSPALLLLLPLLAACAPEVGEGKSEAECSDGLDNDGDGAADCLDAGCMSWDICGDSGDPDDTDDTGPDPDITDVPAVSDPEVTVNEFMASNRTTIEDPDYPGTFPDWIELLNLTDAEVDLAGYTITDDFTECDESVFPEGVTIDPGGFLLLWADHDQEEGPTHLDFALNVDGEQIALCRPDMTPLVKIEYGAQVTDLSMARIPDGSETWEVDQSPTPGASNEL